MPHNQLEHFNPPSPLQKTRGESVSEAMSAYRGTYFSCNCLDLDLKAHRTISSPIMLKDSVTAIPYRVFTDPPPKLFDRSVTHRYHPVLVSLTHVNANRELLIVHIFPFEPQQLSEPQPALAGNHRRRRRRMSSGARACSQSLYSQLADIIGQRAGKTLAFVEVKAGSHRLALQHTPLDQLATECLDDT